MSSKGFLSRRQILAMIGTGGGITLAGCNMFTDQPNTTAVPVEVAPQEQVAKHGRTMKEFVVRKLPIAVRVSFPTAAVQDVPALVHLDLFIKKNGLFSNPRLYDPHIQLQTEGATIAHEFPGNYPKKVTITNTGNTGTITGIGIDTPWKSGINKSFAVAVNPQAGGSKITVRIQLMGRIPEDGPIKKVQIPITIPLRKRPSDGLSQERLAVTADHRARTAEWFSTILAAKESFDEQAKQELREAMLTINLGGVQMLADAAFGEVVGINQVADYLWTTYSLHFTSPFNYLLDGAVPSDPATVDNIEVSKFAPPFFADTLSHSQSLLEDINEIVWDSRWHERKVAEGAATLLCAALADAARAEAIAWREGTPSQARQHLANQLYILTGDNSGADVDAVQERFKAHFNLVEYRYFDEDRSYLADARNLVQHLFELFVLVDDPSPAFSSAVEGIHGVMKGEGNRVRDILTYVEQTETETEEQTETETEEQTETETEEGLSGRGVFYASNRKLGRQGIDKISLDGEVSTVFDSVGVKGLASASDGTFWTTEQKPTSETDKVKQIDKNGQILKEFPSRDEGPRGIDIDHRGAIGQEGLIYVAGKWSSKIIIFHQSGAFMNQYPIPTSRIDDISIDNEGYLWYLIPKTNDVYKTEKSGKQFTVVDHWKPDLTSVPGGSSGDNVRGLSIKDADVWITLGPNKSGLYRFSKNGTYQSMIGGVDGRLYLDSAPGQ